MTKLVIGQWVKENKLDDFSLSKDCLGWWDFIRDIENQDTVIVVEQKEDGYYCSLNEQNYPWFGPYKTLEEAFRTARTITTFDKDIFFRCGGY